MASDFASYLYFAAGAFACYKICGWFFRQLGYASEYKENRKDFERLKNLDQMLDDLEEKQKQVEKTSLFTQEASIQHQKEVEAHQHRIERDKAVLEQLATEKAKGFPWLAEAYAQYAYLNDCKIAYSLERRSRPAKSTAAEIKKVIAKEKRDAIREAKIYRGILNYYEHLYPWLTDLRELSDADIAELLSVQSGESTTLAADEREYLTKYQLLSPQDYNTLTSAEKYQRALDRYWSRRKSNWEIGRDYERYTGWKYESEGYSVDYHGIRERFSDFGRDLIVRKEGKVLIVQCKYWSQNKQIHENQIFQLLGTTIEYRLQHHKNGGDLFTPTLSEALATGEVRPIIITSTVLSPQAKIFAQCLGVKSIEKCVMPIGKAPHPSIKCNIAQGTKERIYHLPFDQQYDKVRIGQLPGECYVDTVAEAEAKGFRRAQWWGGNHD